MTVGVYDVNREKLKAWCDDNVLEFLAWKVGISAGYVHMIIRGDRKPSRKTAKKIEKVTKGLVPWKNWEIKNS